MRCQPVAQIGGERSRAFGSRGAAFGRRPTTRCALGRRVWRTDLAAPATAAAGVTTFATRHVSSRGRTTAVVALQDQCASIRLLLHSIAPSKPRHVPPRSPPPCDVHVSAQQLADSWCCIHLIAVSSAMGEETRSRTRAGKHATLGWFSPPHFSRDVARCGHLLFVFAVAGRRPCLASSLRSPLRAEQASGALAS